MLMPLVVKSNPLRAPVAVRVPKFAEPASQRLGNPARALGALPVGVPATLARLIEPVVSSDTASVSNGSGF